MLKAVGLLFVELMIVTAIALFFSTFSSPMLSAALTFGLYLVGHLSPDFKNLGEALNSPSAGAIARGLYYVLPNLDAFDVKAEVVHAHAVTRPYLLATTGYGMLYIAALLIAAMLIFSRRDFK
jgi:Cu-processing system permease protein